MKGRIYVHTYINFRGKGRYLKYEIIADIFSNNIIIYKTF